MKIWARVGVEFELDGDAEKEFNKIIKESEASGKDPSGLGRLLGEAPARLCGDCYIPCDELPDGFGDAEFELDSLNLTGEAGSIADGLMSDLDYQIYESGFPEEYVKEVYSKLACLELLGYKDEAKEYRDDFNAKLKKAYGPLH